ncbi:hypothetical protein C8R44DRAFT_803195 [Mycena epipterygia]|nr:hypothetical protein C8R44DRAFT_803195 [Mycena epipterygia]
MSVLKRKMQEYTPTITLNEFPMDTLIHLQSFMDPIDIISLRLSSKSMASATRHRTVWLGALRRVCAAHDVSILTYPIEKMTLAALEHAATSPARFLAQMSKNRATDDQVPAFSTRLFQPRLPKSSPGDLGEVRLIRLIPGGRYLVTSSSGARISVWDIGYSPAAVLNPYSVVSTVLAEAPTELLIQPTKNRKGFRILVFYTVGNTLVEVHVFEIYPAEDKPTFTSIAKRRIPSPGLEAFTFTPDRFTYHHDLLITTWDFVQDTSATLQVYESLMGMTVSPTTIVTRDAEGISMVEIPPLHPSGTPAAEAIVEPVTPFPTFSHIHAIFEEPAELHASQSDWHSSPDVPLVLDIFGILVDGSDAYARCLVKPVSGGDSDLPNALPVFMGISRVPPNTTYDAAFYGRLHFAGTHLVRTWPSSDSIMINTAKIPLRRQMEFESKTSWLWEWPSAVDSWLYDLDTVSGRLVVLTTPSEIRIMDYMLPSV